MASLIEQTKKINILMVGQFIPSSGLTSVLNYLHEHLTHRFRISLIGLNNGGSRIEKVAEIVPGLLAGPEIGVSPTHLEALLATGSPDIILLFNEISNQAFHLKQIRNAVGGEKKIVAYTAVDGEVIDAELLSGLGVADRCIFFSQFGFNQASKHIIPSRLSMIPLGVDTNRFYPLTGSVDAQFEGEGRQSVRRKLFAKQPDLLDAFIVLNANRPWLRKRIDVTMEGFGLFARDKPDNVKLFLHHPRTDERERARMLRMGKNYGISDRLLLNPIIEGKSEVSIDELNLLYNACDIGINTAMGEGWGLVSFEHAATGAPQIVPRHSACADIWEGAAEFLEPKHEDVFVFAPHYCLKSVDAEDLAEKLEKFYRQPNYRRAMAHSAYQRVTQPQYQWASIAGQWETLLSGFFET